MKHRNSEWNSFETNGVKMLETKLEKFEAKVQRLKRKELDARAPMGSAKHQFEGLDNALVKLKEQRAELSRAAARVKLPAAFLGKE